MLLNQLSSWILMLVFGFIRLIANFFSPCVIKSVTNSDCIKQRNQNKIRPKNEQIKK